MAEGILRGIYIASRRREALISLESVRAVPALGLEGDRYFFQRGSLSRWPRPERAVTLIEHETLHALLAEGIDLTCGRSRRNLVIEGLRLNDLRGHEFAIGEVLLRATALCQPCAYLERLTASGVLESLRGRGGIRCEILREGILRIGDLVSCPALS